MDQTGLACDNGTCHIVNIDFPDIIKIRNLWMPVHEREENIAADIRNDSWMDQIDGSRGIILFASGVFHYFKTEEVKALVLRLSQHYPNGCLIFDTIGKAGLRLMMSKILKNMGIQDVKGYFCVSDPLKELNWSDTIKHLCLKQKKMKRSQFYKKNRFIFFIFNCLFFSFQNVFADFSSIFIKLYHQGQMSTMQIGNKRWVSHDINQ